MDQLLNIIKNLSITFIVVSPTIFIFCVTLLGDAIEKAQLEEKAARENDAKGNKEEIEGIEKIIVKAKIDGDTTGLTKKLEHLKKNKKSIEARLEKIKNKYDRISLKNTVTIPVLAFVLVLGSIPIVEYGNQKFSVSGSIALLFLLLIFIFGIAKLYWSLQLVQSISASKRQSETYDRVRETIKLALTEHEQSKKEEVNVTFTEKAFPLNVTVST